MKANRFQSYSNVAILELTPGTVYYAHGMTGPLFLERKGNRTGLITSKDFGDTMFSSDG